MSADAISALDRVKAYAEQRGFYVSTSRGSQREPENIVAISQGASPGSSILVSRSSLDSVETAAMYVVNTLQLLGVELPK